MVQKNGIISTSDKRANEWELKAAADEGYLDTEAIFVDGTHIKASANLNKQARKAVPKEAKRYAHELFDEIDKDRETHGKKPFDENNNGNDSGSGDNSGESEMVEKAVSTTDPECGVFHKSEHKKVFAYEARTACDKHNFILGVHVTPGNIHDSVAFDSLYDDICQHYPEHTKSLQPTAPTKPLGSAKESLKVAEF